jgi:nitrate reductase NapAB chaperone NapD
MPGVRTFRFEECYDDRSVIVVVEKSGRARINETSEPLEKLEGTLSLIFQNRQVETEVVFVILTRRFPTRDF